MTPVEAGALVTFDGDVLHYTNVFAGVVKLAGPFALKTMAYVGQCDFSANDLCCLSGGTQCVAAFESSCSTSNLGKCTKFKRCKAPKASKAPKGDKTPKMPKTRSLQQGPPDGATCKDIPDCCWNPEFRADDYVAVECVDGTCKYLLDS